MRKFTLLIASLFFAIGAMAQTPVLHYEDITTRYELTSDDANTIRNLGAMTVIADVEITNSNTPSIVLGAAADYTSAATTNGSIWALGIGGNGMRYIARATDGGWYTRGTVSTSTVKLAYTYNYANNQTTVNYYTEGGTSQGSVTVTDAALSTFNGENAKFYIGGVGHTNSNGWYSAFAGTINSVDIYQGVLSQEEIAALCQPELSEGFVATPEEFVNGKVYTFVTQRGAMGTTETSTNAISTAKTTVSDTNTDYFKWTVYESAKGNFYLYNLGKAMFLGEMSTTANASVPMSENPVAVTFKTTELITHPIMFTTKNDGSCVANHSSSHGEGLITWNGGWNNLTDTGNGHQVVAVAELDAEILSTVEAAVNAFEADNTEAVAALNAAIANAKAMEDYIGTEIGLYSYTGEGNYEEKFAAIVAFRDGITATNDPSPEAVEAKTAELNNLISSFAVNAPATGKYYRLKNAVSNNYMSGNADGSVTVVTNGASASSTIFYLDENNKLLSYTQGRYLDCGNKNLAAVGTSYTGQFAAAYGTPTANQITYKNNGYWTFGNRDDGVSVDRGSSAPNQAGYNWIIEEVESLPVTVTSAGYATLYAPVALTVPTTGVTAHTVTINGEWATLSEALEVVPANTAVVLAGDADTYNFTITTADAFNGTNALRGSVATTYYTEAGTYYALAQVDGVVGFYKDAFNNSRFQNNSHKAYLYIAAEADASAASYSFRFGEGTTGIENVTTENVNVTVIYDLTGRRVEAITAPGIYIVNGVKKLVR